MKIQDLKVGDFIKKPNSSISQKVIEVGYDWRSEKDYVVIYNDITQQKTKLVEVFEYKKV